MGERVVVRGDREQVKPRPDRPVGDGERRRIRRRGPLDRLGKRRLDANDLVDDMFDRLVTIRDETDTAILMVEQNARKALSVSDRGYVLDMGENRFEGAGEELLESDDVAELYLGG